MTSTVKRGTFKRSCRRCGWAGEYATAGLVDYAKRKHNCAKHLAKAEARARAAAREALIDRTPRPCLHKETTHQHGTYACYTLDRCRCRPCADGAAAYERNRVRQNAYGRSGLVDAEPARIHVRQLMAAGMGLKRVAAKASVSSGVTSKLLYGIPLPDGTRRDPCSRMRKATAERLLAVTLDLAPSALVDGKDSARRLQALVALGYSQQYLSEQLGIQRSNLTPLTYGRRDIQAATAKAVHALYVELANSAPPQETPQERVTMLRSQRFAQRRGWLPPVRVGGRVVAGSPLPARDTGDEVALELDATSYDEAAVQRLVDGDRTVAATIAERREAVRRLHARGLHTPAIGLVLRRDTGQVGDDLHALGLKAHPNPERSGLADHFSARSTHRRRQVQEVA